MIKNTEPQTITVDAIKQKARHSASVLSSLILSGWRGSKYVVDLDLLLHFVGIHLIAKSLSKDIKTAERLSLKTFDAEALLTCVKHEIKNEIEYLKTQNN